MQDNQTFLNYIDSEINTLQNEIHQPGWTKWAIMGSIASLFWLLLNEFEEDIYSLSTIFAILFITFLVKTFIDTLIQFTTSTSLPIRTNPRFFGQDHLGKTKLSIILSLLQCIYIFLLLSSLKILFQKLLLYL